MWSLILFLQFSSATFYCQLSKKDTFTVDSPALLAQELVRLTALRQIRKENIRVVSLRFENISVCTPSLKRCRGRIGLWWGERRVRIGGFGVAGWWGWKLQTNVSRDTFHPERPGDTLRRISARLKEDQTHLRGGNLRHYWRRENPNEILNLFCKLNGFLRKAINYGSNVAAWFCALQQPVCLPLKFLRKN